MLIALGELSLEILDKWLHRKKKEGKDEPIRFSVFVRKAEMEIDDLIRRNKNWFSELPYGGAMTKEAARQLEVEKRAVWRRVIYDAERSKLPALRWETSHDENVCSECAKQDSRIFYREDYDLLNQIKMHVGCRCNLVPVRNL